MNTQELLQKYPTRRINVTDGLAVTAEFWKESHDYHHQSQGFLTLFCHGPGIVAGLEVIASDPPDTSVYILPGIAIDPAGQVIVLPQPVAYDIGRDISGLLYLLIGYHESAPRAQDGKQQRGPLYIHTEFSISAQADFPDAPRVELARVRRSSREAFFIDARNPAEPGPDEIDLRYRREVGAPPEISIAVSYLGQVKDKKQGRGLSYLAQALNFTRTCYIRVEDEAPLGPNLLTHTLVYLVGQGDFTLNPGEMTGLRNFVQRRGGTLLLESQDSTAETAFLTFLREKELPVQAIQPGHRLLCRPYLFPAPPPGFETEAEPKLLVGDGIILSGYNYGLLWQGERRGRLASREEIRAATEWGSNILAYAVARRWGR